MRKLSIRRKASYSKIYGTIFFIGMAFINKSLNHLNHFRNFFCCLRMCGSRSYIQCLHILLALFYIFFRYLTCWYPFFYRALDYLIIYISKICNIINIITLMFQVSAKCIKHYHRTCITNMNKIIYCRSAHIDTGFTWVNWYKFFFLSG